MFVLIAGGVPVGVQLAALLLAQDHRVRLIEHHPNVLAEIHKILPTEAIFEGRSTDLWALEEAGIRKADVLVACTSSDSDNLILCYLARKLYAVARTIGRINNPSHAWLFDSLFNVDVALNESSILAHLIEEEMSLGDMMTLLKLRRGQYSLVETIIAPGSGVVGKTLRDLDFPDQCVITAIIRHGEMILPRGSTTLEPGDEILAIADGPGAEQLAELLSNGTA